MSKNILLDAQSLILFEQMKSRGIAQKQSLTLTERIKLEREGYLRIIPMAGEVEPVYEIKIVEINTPEGIIPLKMYYPDATSYLPVLLYFHGGGVVAGGFETHEQQMRYLANHARVLVISVGYRLAPEHKYPAAITDGLESLKWVKQHIAQLNGNPDKIAIGGDSAGGLLSAVIALKASKDKQLKIIFQLLLCPITDLTLSSASWQQLGDKGYVLTLEKQKEYYNWYLPEGIDRKNASVSPLFATDWPDVPPTFIISASADPLKDDSRLYAEQLKHAGVAVIHKEYEGVMHGFYQQAGILEKGALALKEAAAALRIAMLSLET
jgi:acetyl esterase